MNYVTYNDAGELTGAYLQDMLQEHAANSIEVSDDQRLNWTAYRANATRDELEPIGPVAPAPPDVPQSVTMRQARLALLSAGLLGNVNSAIAAMPGDQGAAARIEWEFSSAVMRDQPLVVALAPILGMSDADLDQLFITAGAL